VALNDNFRVASTFFCANVYKWDDSDVILYTTEKSAMLEVYYVTAVKRLNACKLLNNTQSKCTGCK